ncbi:hypothetical protein M9434_005891 [Picochlorum sp. BPE23]|nr:hypothetical protein M9434_005891 [Picochlorum sp. BPE23]
MSSCTSDEFGNLTCINTTVTGENVLTAIILDAILGVLCYIGFVLWRGFFPVYRGREILPGVRYRPPKLSLKTHRRFWTWMIPTFKVTDSEFLKSAGLDALVAVRILSYGIALFIPVGLFGVAILLPVNYTGNGLIESGDTPSNVTNSNLTYLFLRMTISNMPNGSSLMWIHFVFLVVMIGYGCLLVVRYYEENISMRHTLFANYVEDMKKGIAFDADSSAVVPEGQDKSHHDLERIMEGAQSGLSIGEREAAELQRLASHLEAGTVNERVVSMMQAENQTLLAQAFRQTIERPEAGKLWPVMRPRPISDSRPQFAGRYAVLVIDEPRSQYKKSATVSIMRKGETRRTRESLVGRLWNATKSFVKGSAVATEASVSERSDITLNEEKQEAAEMDVASRASGINLHVDGHVAMERKVKSSCCGLVKQSEKAWKKEVQDRYERFTFIEKTFKRLFGEDFDCVIPVYNTEEIDSVLMKRYNTQAAMVRIKLQISNLQSKEQKNKEKAEKKIQKLQAKLDSLEEKDVAFGKLVEEVKREIFSNPARPSFIALFHTAMAANTAANVNANPISWRGFHTMPAPDPENINFPALTRSYGSRSIRSIVTLVCIIFVMLFPLGIFTGAFSQLESAICPASEDASVSASGSWICSDDFWAKLIMSVITGMLPQILMTVYQSVFLPIYIMFCSQAEGKHYSLSSLDLRCAQLFFHWNIWNFFFGTLLGGTIFNGLRQAISNPGEIIDILGTAVPSAANFFINYVILRALTMTMFRLFYPHACVGMNIAQWFYVMPRPKTPMDFARSNPLRNCRFSRDLSISVLTIFVASCTYTVIAPFILPFTMFYFCVMYMVWRYQQLYVYQSTYRSFGQMWTFYAHRLVAVFALTILFTGVMFLIKRAFVQGGIAIIGGELLMLMFNKYITSKYDSIVHEVPVALLEAIPRANLDKQQFLPPSLRKDEEGWFLEHGKAWIFWGAPRYGY